MYSQFHTTRISMYVRLNTYYVHLHPIGISWRKHKWSHITICPNYLWFGNMGQIIWSRLEFKLLVVLIQIIFKLKGLTSSKPLDSWAWYQDELAQSIVKSKNVYKEYRGQTNICRAYFCNQYVHTYAFPISLIKSGTLFDKQF